jgi:hypothetical protein
VQVEDIGIRLGQLLSDRSPSLEDRAPDEPEKRPLVRREMPNPNALSFDRPRHDIRGGPA